MEGFDPDRPITHADFRAMMDIVGLHIHIRAVMTCATMMAVWRTLWGS